MLDTAGNKNIATTITSGIELPGGSGTETIVDVVDPLVEMISTKANGKAGTAEA